MVDKRISELDPADNLSDADITVVVQSGVTKKAPLGGATSWWTWIASKLGAISFLDVGAGLTSEGGYLTADVATVNGRTGAVTTAAADITDSSSAGRAVLTAADASAQRTALGLGNSATRAVGTTSGTVAAGDDSRITGAATSTDLTAEISNRTTADALLVTKAGNLSDLANAATARANLGLDLAYSALLVHGDGSDGDVEITSASTTISGLMNAGFLTRDAYFNNLTLSGSGAINTAGYRIFVRGTLDISAAGADAINRSPINGGGNGGATGTAGTAATSLATNTLGQAGGSVAGGAGGTAAGTAGVANSSGVAAITTVALGGAGGAGSGGAGGAAATPGTITYAGTFRRVIFDMLRGASLIAGGPGATSGGGGGGDGTAGGGGGGSGQSGAFVWISAHTIARGSNATAGIIAANGSNGGNGGSPAAGNRGGGGGGGGGAGGTIYMLYSYLTGSAIAGALSASGGNGGNGGTPSGSGVAGNGGYGGSGGRVTKINLVAATADETSGTGTVAPTGATGGAGEPLSLVL